MKISCNNQSAIFLAKNLVYHSKTKHIDVQYHFVRGMVEIKKVLLEKVDTLEIITDSFTKFVSVVKFSWCREAIGIASLCLLGCYSLCCESLVEVDRLTIEVEEIDSKLKVEVNRPGKVKVEDIDNNSKVEVVCSGKFEVKDIDNKSKRSTNKRLTDERVATT
jgi:hypothetical protein